MQNVMLQLRTIDEYTALLTKFAEIETRGLGDVEEWKQKGESFWLAIGGDP